MSKIHDKAMQERIAHNNKHLEQLFKDQEYFSRKFEDDSYRQDERVGQSWESRTAESMRDNVWQR